MPDAPAPESRTDRILSAGLLVAAAAYAGIAVFAVFVWSPSVPYADQWRHYARLLDGPAPAVLFAADNSHVEILPNLARLLDLRWLGGSEYLQIALTAALLSSSIAIGLRLIWREHSSHHVRAAQTLAITIGVCWLGNLRALSQPGDGVHVYLVMTLVALASLLMLDVSETAAWRRLLLACACCVVAALTFGSGVAAFAAVFAVLLVQRAAFGLWLLATAALLATLAAYFLLAGASGAPLPDLLVALLTTLRVLGSPFMYVFWPLLDPAAAAAVPAPLHDVAVAAATAWTARFGDIRRAVLPQALCGAASMLWLLRALWRARRAGIAPAASVRFGVALASFGAAVCALIAVVRQDYFMVHADQIVALRYVPWSSLCWCGLGIAQLAWARRERAALIAMACVAMLIFVADVGMAVLARHVRDVAEDTALAAAVGVLPQDMPLGETDPVDLEAALPHLRAASTAMFAWPEVERLGQALPVSAIALDAPQISVTSVANRLGEPGRAIQARVSGACRTPRIFVVDGNIVAGLLRHASTDVWRGVVRGDTSGSPLLFCPAAGSARE